jgi:hypothetical protein
MTQHTERGPQRTPVPRQGQGGEKKPRPLWRLIATTPHSEIAATLSQQRRRHFLIATKTPLPLCRTFAQARRPRHFADLSREFGINRYTLRIEFAVSHSKQDAQKISIGTKTGPPGIKRHSGEWRSQGVRRSFLVRRGLAWLRLLGCRRRLCPGWRRLRVSVHPSRATASAAPRRGGCWAGRAY